MFNVVVPILLASAIPFVLALVAKIGAFSARDNHQTRVWYGNLDGWRKRAGWAQANAFETLPVYIAAVICAHLALPHDGIAAALAWAYPATRLAYTYCYLADKAALRSLVWNVGLLVIIALFIRALM